MKHFLCVHGHFYQPPRENPWLEAIEPQDSAYPYHDWNERITSECYAPNASARILDDDDRIRHIVNNYARISFNFGPTLLRYLEDEAPQTYHAILEADRDSARRFGGHGSAMAQAYNHMIMPLASERDRRCQVAWGIRDFRHRFGRRPIGMWLPETAVDLPSLEALAEAGIAFTVLEPGQARRVRPSGETAWTDTDTEPIDPTRAYRQHLASGRHIDLLFYDGPVSRSVAFDRLLDRGDAFAARMVGAFRSERDHAQLVHLATDGETYGHHHRHGDMALAFALDHIERQDLATLTNYAQFLAEHPPVHEVEIKENTSWSCAHGIGRWSEDCGCHSGAHAAWNQAWRAGLRQALDWLRDELAALYESWTSRYLDAPWDARIDSIDVILDRSAEARERFLSRHAGRSLEAEERVIVWKLLEMQRHAMLMYTSCGWFFDDLSGIETIQVLQYAGRAMQLAREITGVDLEPELLDRISVAKSNRPARGNGREIYLAEVRPAMVDLPRVAAHYAATLPFRTYPTRSTIYGYEIDSVERSLEESGRAKLATGRVRITSSLTEERADLTFAVVHLGDHNLTGGVRHFRDEASFESMRQEFRTAFATADLPTVVRRVDAHFEGETFSMKSLFRDEQRSILTRVMESTVEEAEAAYRRLHEHHAPLVRFLVDLGMPLPKPFRAAAEFVTNQRMLRALEADEPDVELVRRLIEEAQKDDITLDEPGLALAAQQTAERQMERLQRLPDEAANVRRLAEVAGLARELPFHVDLWRVENGFYRILVDRAQRAGASSPNWRLAAAAAAETLRISDS